MDTLKKMSVLIIIFTVGQLCDMNSYAAEKVNLRLALKPNQAFGVQLSTNQQILRETEDSTKKDSFVTIMGLDFFVKNVDPNGVASVKVTYRTLRIRTKRPGRYSAEYDSTKQYVDMNKPFIPAEAGRVGLSFVMRVTPNGEVLKLNGIEQMLLEMAENFMALQDKAMTKKAREIVKSRYGSIENRRKGTIAKIKTAYGKDQVLDMLKYVMCAFPVRPVAIGDTWANNLKVLNRTHQIDVSYTLKDISNQIATIHLSSKDVSIGMGSSKMIALCQGVLEIDTTTGWLVHSKVETQISHKSPNKDNEPKGSINSVIAVTPIPSSYVNY